MYIRGGHRPHNRIARLAQPRHRREKYIPTRDQGRVCAIGKPPSLALRPVASKGSDAMPPIDCGPRAKDRQSPPKPNQHPGAAAVTPPAPPTTNRLPPVDTYKNTPSRVFASQFEEPRSPRDYALRSGNKLGEGSFGAVYRVESPRTKRQLAVKQVKFRAQGLTFDQQREVKKEALKEARLLKALDHPNIVKQENCKLYRNDLRIVMELIEGSDFQDYIKAHGTLSEDEAKVVFKKIVGAIAYAHSQGIVHRDLKPANVMRTNSGDVKVVDFGVGTKVSSTNLARTCIGTPLFIAPEKTGRSSYDAKASDVWEAGMTLLFMLVDPPADRYAKDRVAVMWRDPKVSALSSDCKSLLRRMLHTNPRFRPTMSEVLRHPWFLGA